MGYERPRWAAPTFQDQRITESFWQLQSALDTLTWMSRQAGRPILGGYGGTALRALWAFAAD